MVENTAKLSEDTSNTLAPEDDYQDDPYGFADDEGDHETAGNTVPEIRFQHHAHREKAGKNDAPSELSAKIEALETAIGKISDNWEPDGTDSDDNAATPLPAMAWEDEETEDEPPEALTWPDDEPRDETADATVAQSAEEQRVALEDDMPAEATIAQRIEEQPLVVDDDMPAHQDEAVAPRSADPDDHIDLSPEDQLIDEDGLRDLISDIVREELQGALGERITRNVRKLVRREIHRALTARDLD
ncbi:hypothetical protein [Sulfitobacter aestuariivivens]|uniref:hypothetical protein n=1 Tax=Sulfitobacter aestuariivivens TaxID=2766981 RepID=UPI00360D1FCA